MIQMRFMRMLFKVLNLILRQHIKIVLCFQAISLMLKPTY